MQQSSFPMGAWIYRDLDQTTKKDVEHWRDCGLTLTISPYYDHQKHDKQKMLELMDYCYECGIRLIVSDKRALWKGAATDPEGYKKAFKDAYNDFGKHKATWGFYVGDEPELKNAPDVVKAYKIQLEVAPELVPFVNYLPFWKPEIEEISNAIFPNIDMKNLCYDYYGHMIKTLSPDGYFTQLKKFREEADKYNSPLWVTLLSIGHWDYETPNKDDFVWQISTAVASGCEGILWFSFYSEMPFFNNYRNGPINLFGERSFTYTYLSEAVREFHHFYGEQFTHLKLVKSYHIGEAYGGFPLFKEGDSDVILKVEDIKYHNPVILSFFKDENGDDYFTVVNNSRTGVARISTTISSKAGKIINVGNGKCMTPASITEAIASNNAAVPETYDHVIWHAPGQLHLYKIEK